MNRPTAVRTLILFAILFVALQSGFVNLPEAWVRAVNHRLNAIPCAALVNRITPGDNARADGAFIRSRAASLEILKGCEGFEVMLLLASALLAHPMPWRRKLAGLAVGAAVFHLLNLVRLTSLYYVVRLRPAWFDALHVVIWQSFMVLAAAAFFLWWIRPARPAGIPPRPSAPQ